MEKLIKILITISAALCISKAWANHINYYSRVFDACSILDQSSGLLLSCQDNNNTVYQINFTGSYKPYARYDEGFKLSCKIQYEHSMTPDQAYIQMDRGIQQRNYTIIRENQNLQFSVYSNQVVALCSVLTASEEEIFFDNDTDINSIDLNIDIVSNHNTQYFYPGAEQIYFEDLEKLNDILTGKIQDEQWLFTQGTKCNEGSSGFSSELCEIIINLTKDSFYNPKYTIYDRTWFSQIKEGSNLFDQWVNEAVMADYHNMHSYGFLERETINFFPKIYLGSGAAGFVVKMNANTVMKVTSVEHTEKMLIQERYSVFGSLENQIEALRVIRKSGRRAIYPKSEFRYVRINSDGKRLRESIPVVGTILLSFSPGKTAKQMFDQLKEDGLLGKYKSLMEGYYFTQIEALLLENSLKIDKNGTYGNYTFNGSYNQLKKYLKQMRYGEHPVVIGYYSGSTSYTADIIRSNLKNDFGFEGDIQHLRKVINKLSDNEVDLNEISEIFNYDGDMSAVIKYFENHWVYKPEEIPEGIDAFLNQHIEWIDPCN